eukprot:SAG22_NODE_1422_length_4464_cov_3.424742_2_plen_168_part_00
MARGRQRQRGGAEAEAEGEKEGDGEGEDDEEEEEEEPGVKLDMSTESLRHVALRSALDISASILNQPNAKVEDWPRQRKELIARLADIEFRLSDKRSTLRLCLGRLWKRDHPACVALPASCEEPVNVDSSQGDGIEEVRRMLTSVERLPVALGAWKPGPPLRVPRRR